MTAVQIVSARMGRTTAAALPATSASIVRLGCSPQSSRLAAAMALDGRPAECCQSAEAFGQVLTDPGILFGSERPAVIVVEGQKYLHQCIPDILFRRATLKRFPPYSPQVNGLIGNAGRFR
jgi:hypothetical protein